MTKQYKGRTATIEIDEKNVIIKSSGFFSSSKKTIPLRDIKNVELSASSFFSKDTVEIYYGSNVEKVQFSNSADAKKAATDITDMQQALGLLVSLAALAPLLLYAAIIFVDSTIKNDSGKGKFKKQKPNIKRLLMTFLTLVN